MSGRVRSLLFAAVLCGCTFAPPDYADTEYRCSAPDFSCPPGQMCVDGRCTTSSGAAADAGRPDGADAPPPEPDAPTGITLTFGETPGADVTGVTEDTYLHAGNPLQNYGASPILDIDEDVERVALLRFDLSAIPVDAEVVSATLYVWTEDNPFQVGTVAIHRVLEAWTEGDEDGAPGAASWQLRRTVTPWTTAGAGPGSRDADLAAELTANDIQTEHAVPLPQALVQDWVGDPAANHGVVIRTRNAETTGGYLHSSESPAAARRPRLVVTYR